MHSGELLFISILMHMDRSENKNLNASRRCLRKFRYHSVAYKE